MFYFCHFGIKSLEKFEDHDCVRHCGNHNAKLIHVSNLKKYSNFDESKGLPQIVNVLSDSVLVKHIELSDLPVLFDFCDDELDLELAYTLFGFITLKFTDISFLPFADGFKQCIHNGQCEELFIKEFIMNLMIEDKENATTDN